VRHPGGGGVVLGEVVPRAADPAAEAAVRAIQGDGVALAGWDILRPAVLPLVMRDLHQVFLPMVLVMAGMLWVVFRRSRDVGFELLALAFSGLMLCGIMAVADLHWTFLNVAAIPLLVGTGVDYGIHMLLAIRRTGGDFARVWHGTGKAILFCGVSTAIEAMRGMGIVCACGILLNMLTAVFLLPGWHALKNRPR